MSRGKLSDSSSLLKRTNSFPNGIRVSRPKLDTLVLLRNVQVFVDPVILTDITFQNYTIFYNLVIRSNGLRIEALLLVCMQTVSP